jgi:hypothetical protein
MIHLLLLPNIIPKTPLTSNNYQFNLKNFKSFSEQLNHEIEGFTFYEQRCCN